MKTRYFPMNEAGEPAAGGGLYNEGTPAPTGDAPPAPTGGEIKTDWNAENWKDFLDEDVKTDPSLKAIKDLKGLAKSYVHAQRMVGSDKILVPNQYATDEEWEQIYNKLGRPESPDKYELKLENSQISDDFLKGMKETAHKVGLSGKQVTAFAEFYNKQLTEAQTKIAQHEEIQYKQEVDTLKKEWGQAYGSKIKAAQTAISAFGGNEMLKYLSETGLDKDTKLARFFAKIGEALAEDDTNPGKPGNGILTPQEAQSRLSMIMNDPAYLDGNHPNHKNLVDEALNVRRMMSAR